METQKIESSKHIKYLKRHLSLLPSSHQSQDVNKMAIIFYSITSLAALGLDVSTEYLGSLEWIYTHYVTIKPLNSMHLLSGFIGSSTMKVAKTNTISLPNTLFALLTLSILRDDHFFNHVLDKGSLFKFVSSCQVDCDGSFVSVLDYKKCSPSPVDASDLRFCFIAVAILHLLGCRTIEDYANHVNVKKLIAYILSQQCDLGGFGAYNEPHAGFTSCSLSALNLLGSMDSLTDTFKENTLSWLVHRQVSNEGCMHLQGKNSSFDEDDHGGFQGRENKFADTCYAFWCLNSIQILCGENTDLLKNFKPAQEYLVERTQNRLIGGFSKTDADDPDLYHTCFGIAALKLMEGSFNGPLFIPNNVMTI